MPLISTLAGVAAKAYGFIMAAAEIIIGKTWTVGGSPSVTNWATFRYGNGYFFGAQNSGSTWSYSTDGVTWTNGSSVPAPSLAYVDSNYGNGYYAVISFNENKLVYTTSINGSWSSNFSIPTEMWRKLAYGNGNWVIMAGGNSAAGNDTNVAGYRATNPTGSFTATTLPSAAFWNLLEYGNNFVAIATLSGGANTNKAAYSTNGVSWTAATLPTSAYWTGLTFNSINSTWVATAISANGAYSTNAGATWTGMTMPSSGTWFVSNAGNGFVAMREGTTIAATSSNGFTWTTRTLPTTTSALDRVQGNATRAVVVSSNGRSPGSSAWSIG
jgi:hypothetical protein